jgi:membrane protein implicated in regulation of membrane protease activity
MLAYILENMWQVWAVVAVICLILELMAGDFFIICFSTGALGGLLTALLSDSLYLQLFAFAVFTVLALVYVRPFAKGYLHKGEDSRVSNADALMGRQGRVVETVKAGGFGRVQIDGDIWKAVTNGEADIPEGSNVVVIDRASTIITVKTLNIKD